MQWDDSLVDFWRRNQWHPRGDLEYVRYEFEKGTGKQHLDLTVIRNRSEILACAMGRIEKLPLSLQFGYRFFHGPTFNSLVVHKSGLIGNWSQPLCELLADRWQELFSSGSIDVLWLRGIPLDSPLHGITSSKVPLHRRDHFPTVQEYWLLTQLDSFESFLSNHRNLKKTYRKHGNRLDRLFAGKMEMRCYRHPDELALMLRDSEEVGIITWQRKHGAPSFLDDEERGKFEFYFSRGWCRSYILYLEGNPVAFQHGIVYQGVFYALTTGYDPAYRRLGIGGYLLMNVIRDLCRDVNIHSMDFNVGNDEDKKQYCDSSFKVADIHLFGPGMRLWAVILLRLAAQGGHHLAKRLAQRFGAYGSLRTRLR